MFKSVTKKLKILLLKVLVDNSMNESELIYRRAKFVGIRNFLTFQSACLVNICIARYTSQEEQKAGRLTLESLITVAIASR